MLKLGQNILTIKQIERERKDNSTQYIFKYYLGEIDTTDIEADNNEDLIDKWNK